MIVKPGSQWPVVTLANAVARCSAIVAVIILTSATATTVAQMASEQSGSRPVHRLRFDTVKLAADCPAAQSGDCRSFPVSFGPIRPSSEMTVDGRWIETSTFEITRTPSVIGFGPTWRIKADTSYRAGRGFILSAGVVVRRGDNLPLYMLESLTGDTLSSQSPYQILEFARTPTVFHTDLRIQKNFDPLGPLHVAVVGEAFNLVNVDRRVRPSGEQLLLTSRTLRGGVILGF